MNSESKVEVRQPELTVNIMNPDLTIQKANVAFEEIKTGTIFEFYDKEKIHPTQHGYSIAEEDAWLNTELVPAVWTVRAETYTGVGITYDEINNSQEDAEAVEEIQALEDKIVQDRIQALQSKRERLPYKGKREIMNGMDTEVNALMQGHIEDRIARLKSQEMAAYAGVRLRLTKPKVSKDDTRAKKKAAAKSKKRNRK